MSSAIGLPAQDFDLTVGLVTLVLCVPVWGVAVAAIFGVIAAIHYLLVLAKMLLNRSLSEVVVAFGQCIGAFVCAFLSIYGFEYVTRHHREADPAIRLVAYFVDYQPAPKYPGIGAQERVRLHENGIISVAVPVDDGGIEIRQRMFDPR